MWVVAFAATSADAYAFAATSAHAPRVASSSVATVRARTCLQHSKGWDGFGKGPFRFYDDFNSFMSPFPDEDRKMYPEMFQLPKGCYEVAATEHPPYFLHTATSLKTPLLISRQVALERPLGIAFEEVEVGRGVKVDYLVDDGNAAVQGVIQPGDVLIAVTAVKVFGARYERKLLPCYYLDFDTIMSAIASNEPRWSARDVVMMFERPSESCGSEKTKEFLDFFEIPYDHVSPSLGWLDSIAFAHASP